MLTKDGLRDALLALDPAPEGEFAILDDHERHRPWVVVCDDQLVVATTSDAALDEVKRLRAALARIRAAAAPAPTGGGSDEPGDGTQAGS